MAWAVILALFALPVLEIMVFVKSSQAIGVLGTIGLAVLAGMAGVALIKREGLATALKARAQMEHGQLPVEQAFDAMILVVAGVLLVLPGFLSDVVALVLLLPPVRRLIRAWAIKRFGAPVRPGVIEADYTVVDQPPPPHLPPTGEHRP
jgi:UPF0716 protein FxsA